MRVSVVEQSVFSMELSPVIEVELDERPPGVEAREAAEKLKASTGVKTVVVVWPAGFEVY